MTDYIHTISALGQEAAQHVESRLYYVTGRAAAAVEQGKPERVAKHAAQYGFSAKNRGELAAFIAGITAGQCSQHVRLLSPDERAIILGER